MKLKRGILIAVVLYLVTFVIGVLLTILSNYILGTPKSTTTSYWITAIATTVILTSFASLWYFNKAKRDSVEGLKLGLIFIIVGFLLDIIFLIPLYIAGVGEKIMIEYYTTPSFYITLLLVIATSTFIGSLGKSEEIKQVKKIEIKEKEEVKKSKKSKKR